MDEPVELVHTGRPLPRERAWSLLADFDRLHRMAGFPPLRWRVEAGDQHLGHIRGELLGPGGIRHLIDESDQHWVVGRLLRKKRRLTGLLLSRWELSLELVDEDQLVRPVLRLALLPRLPLMRGPLRLLLRLLLRAWQPLLQGELPEEEAWRPRPGQALEQALSRWAERGAGPARQQQLRGLLEHGAVPELLALQPHALAERWEEAPGPLIEDLIGASAVGLLDPIFRLRCIFCGAPQGRWAEAAGLPDKMVCPWCDRRSLVDLRAGVEVVWSAPDTVLPHPDESGCTEGPLDRPDLALILTLPPGGRADGLVELRPGAWRLVAAGPPGQDLELELGTEGGDDLNWPATSPQQLKAGLVQYRLRNPDPRRPRRLMLIRCGLPRLSGLDLATHPAWQRAAGPLSLNPRVHLDVSEVTILFADLAGSTAFYRRHGDRPALSAVREHLELVERVVLEHGGVRVKTLGDATMAAFAQVAQAVAACLALPEAHRRWVEVNGLAADPELRLGVAVGSALALHTDASGLDYAGETASLAARAASLAPGGAAVWTRALWERPEAQALLGEGHRATLFDQSTGGLAAPEPFVRVESQWGLSPRRSASEQGDLGTGGPQAPP